MKQKTNAKMYIKCISHFCLKNELNLSEKRLNRDTKLIVILS